MLSRIAAAGAKVGHRQAPEQVGGLSQYTTSSGTHETEKPGLWEVGLFRFETFAGLRRRELVSPALLGLVQRLVGGANECFGRIAMLGEGRHAH